MRIGVFGAALGIASAVVAGCTVKQELVDDSGQNGGSSGQYKQLGEQFGNHVIKGDWTAAYAMTTPGFQANVSQAQMQQQYDEIVSQIRRSTPSFTPTRAEADTGSLPVDEAQATRYGVKTVPPKSTWKAWMFATLIGDDPEGRAIGLETRLFLVSDNGQDKFAHVYFDHIN